MSLSYEINWNSFKAKFNGREQNEFERLSYILFCLEHGQKFGIFRYKNQAGIETNPIEVNSHFIGFQSKFYDTKISENESDIKDSIQKAKNKNPNLSKILLYLNKELSESSDKSKQKPQYQENIEKYAQNLGIEIEWRIPSHFERQLIEPDNHWLWEIFFSLEKGLLDFVSEVECHSKNNLEAIRTEIMFGEQRIKIDRTATINEIISDLSKTSPIVVAGSGGTGKTALIKDLAGSLGCPFFVFKAFEFSNRASINDLFSSFGAYTFNDFMGAYKDVDLKIVVIDSAEKLSDIENKDVFQAFIRNLLKDSWKIIFTTREMYLNDLTFELENSYQIGFSLISITILTGDELFKIAQENSFELPLNEKLKEILAIPFYLS